jgi:hypothetical protein
MHSGTAMTERDFFVYTYTRSRNRYHRGLCVSCFRLPDSQRNFLNHKADTMVKRQKGLTIIQLMVLLLIAGIAGSVLLKIIIEHRCQSDRSAPHCMKQANSWQ